MGCLWSWSSKKIEKDSIDDALKEIDANGRNQRASFQPQKLTKKKSILIYASKKQESTKITVDDFELKKVFFK